MLRMKGQAFFFPFEYALLPARFVKRPNRFLAHVQKDGQILPAHVPDPGRLKELLLPGAEVMVRHNPGPGRKTDWTLTLVKKDRVWVCINTQIPNAFVGDLLRSAALPEYERFPDIRPETKYENSRIDFLLSSRQEQYWLEVKSVSLVHRRVGLFPDAPTKRGVRHLRHLMELHEKGDRAGVLFMVQRSDADRFAPNGVTDPEFANTLREAHQAGVEMNIYTSEVQPEGISLGKSIPLDLELNIELPAV